MSGGGAGGGIGYSGHNHGTVAGWIAMRRARRQTLQALEADLTERGIVPPPRLLSQPQMFWIGFLCGLLVGVFAGGLFWELT